MAIIRIILLWVQSIYIIDDDQLQGVAISAHVSLRPHWVQLWTLETEGHVPIMAS